MGWKSTMEYIKEPTKSTPMTIRTRGRCIRAFDLSPRVFDSNADGGFGAVIGSSNRVPLDRRRTSDLYFGGVSEFLLVFGETYLFSFVVFGEIILSFSGTVGEIKRFRFKGGGFGFRTAEFWFGVPGFCLGKRPGPYCGAVA